MILTSPDRAREAAKNVTRGAEELAREDAQSLLAANAAAGDRIRTQADRVQLRLALHNLKEGVRGMIRVSPLSAVFLGLVLGIALGKRHPRVAAPRRRG